MNRRRSWYGRGQERARDRRAGRLLRSASEHADACAGGDTPACLARGRELERGGDPAAAAPLYARACDAGVIEACNDLGALYGRGDGVTRDDARAAALYEKACDGGDALACTNLAAFAVDGVGVPKDVARGLALYEKACGAGEASACRDLGFAYVATVVPPDPAKGAEIWLASCEAGHAQSCADLGWLHEEGRGVPQDAERAQALYHRACRGGYERACGAR